MVPKLSEVSLTLFKRKDIFFFFVRELPPWPGWEQFISFSTKTNALSKISLNYRYIKQIGGGPIVLNWILGVKLLNWCILVHFVNNFSRCSVPKNFKTPNLPFLGYNIISSKSLPKYWNCFSVMYSVPQITFGPKGRECWPIKINK